MEPKKVELVTFLDGVGRTIIGEKAKVDDTYIYVKNPAVVNVVQQQDPNTSAVRMHLQLFPLFFKEFLADKDVVAVGHTHIPFVKRVGDSFFVNCGSVGQPRDGSVKASFAVFDTDWFTVKIVRVAYDIKTAAEKILNAKLPTFLAQRLFRGV